MVPTDEDFVRQWAAENGWHVEAEWLGDGGCPAYVVVIDNGIKTCTAPGETIELAFSRMASMIKGEDPF